MADYFVVNGNPYPVSAGATQKPITIGETIRAFNGTLRSTLQNVRREWTVVTSEIDDPTYDQMLVDLQVGFGLPQVSGLMVEGNPAQCFCHITDEKDMIDFQSVGAVRKRMVTILVQEV